MRRNSSYRAPPTVESSYSASRRSVEAASLLDDPNETITSKLQKLQDQQEQCLRSGLSKIHNTIVNLDVSFQKDVLVLQHLYQNKFYKPLLQLRAMMLNTVSQTEKSPSWNQFESQIRKTMLYSTENDDYNDFLENCQLLVSASPHLTCDNLANEFWLNVMLHSDKCVRQLMRQNDDDIMKHLIDVSCTSITSETDPTGPTASLTNVNDQDLGFALCFKFSQNPYFYNRRLVKEYRVKVYPEEKVNENGLIEYNGPRIVATTGTAIDWKVKRTRKTIKNRSSGHQFGSILEYLQYSWSSSRDQISRKAQEDYQIGVYIKDVMIPKAFIIHNTDFKNEGSSTGEGGAVKTAGDVCETIFNGASDRVKALIKQREASRSVDLTQQRRSDPGYHNDDHHHDDDVNLLLQAEPVSESSEGAEEVTSSVANGFPDFSRYLDTIGSTPSNDRILLGGGGGGGRHPPRPSSRALRRSDSPAPPDPARSSDERERSKPATPEPRKLRSGRTVTAAARPKPKPAKRNEEPPPTPVVALRKKKRGRPCKKLSAPKRASSDELSAREDDDDDASVVAVPSSHHRSTDGAITSDEPPVSDDNSRFLRRPSHSETLEYFIDLTKKPAAGDDSTASSSDPDYKQIYGESSSGVNAPYPSAAAPRLSYRSGLNWMGGTATGPPQCNGVIQHFYEPSVFRATSLDDVTKQEASPRVQATDFYLRRAESSSLDYYTDTEQLSRCFSGVSLKRKSVDYETTKNYWSFAPTTKRARH